MERLNANLQFLPWGWLINTHGELGYMAVNCGDTWDIRADLRVSVKASFSSITTDYWLGNKHTAHRSQFSQTAVSTESAITRRRRRAGYYDSESGTEEYGIHAVYRTTFVNSNEGSEAFKPSFSIRLLVRDSAVSSFTATANAFRSTYLQAVLDAQSSESFDASLPFRLWAVPARTFIIDTERRIIEARTSRATLIVDSERRSITADTKRRVFHKATRYQLVA